VYEILVGKSQEKKTLEDQWEHNSKIGLKEISCERMYCIQVA